MSGPAMFHGTKHAFTPGETIEPALACIVNPCAEEGTPAAYGNGCSCAPTCDPRTMIWATPDLEVAWFAAQNRLWCACADPYSPDHEPRVFEVRSEHWEADPNNYSGHDFMAPSAVVVRQMR